LNLVTIEWISLPPCATPGKPRLDSTSMDKDEKPQWSVTPS